MNLPNKLTLVRILMIPVFVFFASATFVPANYFWAGLVFTLASITDALDGSIARKQGLVTDFGKFADPLADKILTTTALIYMMADGVCHPVVLVLVLAREFAVSGVRMIAAGAPNGEVIAASVFGKVKTVVQMVSIISYYALMGLLQFFPVALPLLGVVLLIAQVLCWLVAAFTVLSGLQYLYRARRYINTAK